MLKPDLHRLLKRQIANAGFLPEDIKKFESFFEVVNDAYKSFDEDVKHIEVILEESSNELYKLNQALKSQVDSVENELNTIVNTIEGVIFKTDMVGNFSYLNKAWEELFGVSVDEAIGKNYKDMLFGINDKEKERINSLLRLKQQDYTTLFKYHKPSGELIWVQLRLVLIYDKDGNPTGTIGFMSDVTQLKETELELFKANKTKDEFLSTMSHEIRTPLNAVIGMSDILLMEQFLPEQLENLQVLKYSSEHLLALVNNLLDLNKYKSDEIKLNESDFSLIEIIQNIRLPFQKTATKKNLKFNCIVNGTIPAVLKGDALKLSQVLKNLLSNAFKFTHNGGVTFKVQVLEQSDYSQKIRFSVKDTGIGVSYDKQKDIFKSFVQATENTSVLYGGSGLGLYISKELLKVQNSRLNLESKKDEGSKFWFDIEFKRSQTKREPLTSKSYIRETEAIDLKVLVAEDNRLNAMLLKKLFKKWEIEYVIANNGQELLDEYAKDDYNIILMDLQMPILDGYETTREIRKLSDPHKAQIPIIALTAFSESEVGEKLKNYKMDGYVSKPFNVNELHKLLKFYSANPKEAV